MLPMLVSFLDSLGHLFIFVMIVIQNLMLMMNDCTYILFYLSNYITAHYLEVLHLNIEVESNRKYQPAFGNKMAVDNHDCA